ncbi:MAG: PQQ-dependent sugar dehydrogenase [Acidimicrobiales bacterium]|nr:PQQ-dependent sugar dehydrogenase [Acidimicrobiales bacterium]
MNRTARLALVASLLLGAALSGCGSDGDGSPSTSTQPGSGTPSTGVDGTTSADPAAVEGEPTVSSVVVGRAAEPIVLLARPGDDALWLAERAGLVRRMAVGDDGALTAIGDPVLDLTADTSVDAERGLLGVAFSPEGDQLFVSYTNTGGNTRIDAYDLDGDEVAAGSRTERFAQDQPYANHNGGNIAFGPDGLLWLGLGDGGAADDPENRAQDPSTVLGKIIRLDVLGDDEQPEPEIVVSGVRNPWRWAFDVDGSLWIGDVGQNRIEEVDHLPADEIEGANLGWSGFEGREPYLDGDGRRPDDPVDPVFQYTHDDGNCSITGGFAYRGAAIPSLQGAYLFADYCKGRVRAIRLDDAGALASEHDLGIDVENPISFGTDADGEAYVLSAAGDIVRLTDAG